VQLFDGFELSLDLGQVVPAKVGGDLRFTVGKDGGYLEPVGKAELYLVSKNLPEATPKKLPRPEVGAAFEPRFFNGVYQLHDDGRRSGKLHLKVIEKNEVTGWFYSDKDGKKYEVTGKVGVPTHSIHLRITYPRTIQELQGWLFTGDGAALTGMSRMEEREAGFYAVRVNE
jgi:hypothetical protein